MALEKIATYSAMLAIVAVGTASVSDKAWNFTANDALEEFNKNTDIFKLDPNGTCYALTESQKEVLFIERLGANTVFVNARGLDAFADHTWRELTQESPYKKMYALGNVPAFDAVNSKAACNALATTGNALTLEQATQKLTDSYNGLKAAASRLEKDSPSAHGEITLRSVTTPTPEI